MANPDQRGTQATSFCSANDTQDPGLPPAISATAGTPDRPSRLFRERHNGTAAAPGRTIDDRWQKPILAAIAGG